MGQILWLEDKEKLIYFSKISGKSPSPPFFPPVQRVLLPRQYFFSNVLVISLNGIHDNKWDPCKIAVNNHNYKTKLYNYKNIISSRRKSHDKSHIDIVHFDFDYTFLYIYPFTSATMHWGPYVQSLYPKVSYNPMTIWTPRRCVKKWSCVDTLFPNYFIIIFLCNVSFFSFCSIRAAIISISAFVLVFASVVCNGGT